MNSGGLFRTNWSYLMWFAFNFSLSLLFVNIIMQDFSYALAIVLLLYVITLLIAFSSLGERIIRNSLKIRPLKTLGEKEQLLPIFDEVYKDAKKLTPSLSNNVSLYILEEMEINAFAVGSNTIVITKGAILGLSSNALRGLIAHEFGHIAHGDTKALLLTQVGNGFFSFMTWLVDVFIRISVFIVSRRKDTEYVLWVIKAICGVLRFVIWIIKGIGNIIIPLNSRYSEHLADSYAIRLGYSDGLITSLKTMYKISPDSIRGTIDRIKMSHPYTLDRIERIENQDGLSIQGSVGEVK